MVAPLRTPLIVPPAVGRCCVKACEEGKGNRRLVVDSVT